MVDVSAEHRALMVQGGGYLSENPRHHRHNDERIYLQRPKDQSQSDRFTYKPIISYNGLKEHPSQYVTLQASPSSDGVEFVTLEDFFITDNNVVYEQIIPTGSHQNDQNETVSQNGILNYIPQNEVTSGGCIVQLEPVLPSLSNGSYSNLPTDSLPYDLSQLPEHRDDYLISQQNEGHQRPNSVNPTQSNNGVNPVPIQIVRPQQLLRSGPKLGRSQSTSQVETLMSHMSNSPSSSGSSPPKPSTRKRGTRTSSLGSSSDEGSLMNLSMSSDGRGDEYGDDDGGKHRRSKQPVPDSNKDEKYWRRRQKNNLAAKRSREARKMKETETNERAAILEEQFEVLQKALDDIRRQNGQLRSRLSKYENVDDLQDI